MCTGHTTALIEDVAYIWGGHEERKFSNVLYAFNVDAHKWFRPHRVAGNVPERPLSLCVAESHVCLWR